MDGFSIALLALAFLLSIVSVSTAVQTALRLRALSEVLRIFDPSQMESQEKRLLEVQQALEELATSVRMSKVRRAGLKANSESDLPDPYKDPDAWRQAVNSKLGRQKHGL